MKEEIVQLPTNDDAAIIAVNVASNVKPKLTAQEESFFIAGFIECVKYLRLQIDSESDLTTLRSRVKELEDGKEANRIELGNFLAETIADNLMGMRDTKEFSKEWAMCAGKKSLAESILIKFT